MRWSSKLLNYCIDHEAVSRVNSHVTLTKSKNKDMKIKEIKKTCPVRRAKVRNVDIDKSICLENFESLKNTSLENLGA